MQYKTLLVGVSEYRDNIGNLPNCVQDVAYLANTLIDHLAVPADAITRLTGKIIRTDFDRAFTRFLEEPADVGIFYFSGHGSSNNTVGHCLRLTDQPAVTDHLIRDAAKSVDSLIVIIDSCYSGSSKPYAALEDAINNACGAGCAVFASSSPDEYSWVTPETTTSVFTYHLCTALSLGYMRTEGMTSLDSVERVLRTSLEKWNDRNPKHTQHIVIRHDMSGTLFFPDPTFTPYLPSKPIMLTTETFSVADVESAHIGMNKRYRIKVLLSQNCDLESIGSIAPEIVHFAKNQQVFRIKRQEDLLRQVATTYVFVFIYPSKMDLIHNNVKYRLIWVDDAQDKEHWYQDKGILINDCWIIEDSSYEFLHAHTENNQISDEEAFGLVVNLFERIDSLGKRMLYDFDEYLNYMKTEDELIEAFRSYIPEKEELLQESMNLGYADSPYEKLINTTIGLVGDLSDIILFYTADAFLQRSTDNRKRCVFDVRARYFHDYRLFKDQMTAHLHVIQ